MRPDDPRHGTTAGHVAGCRCDPCSTAKLRYDKRRKWEAANGKPRTVPVWRVMRRIRALQAIGWSVPRIAEHSGLTMKTIYGFRRSDSVQLATFREVDAAFRRLSMVTPTGPGTTRAKRNAERNGWAPPLAWDDIDNPNERPTRWQYLHVDRAGALRDLVDMGVGITEACNRLHVSRDSLERWCERHGMRAEYATLLDREDAMQDYGRGRPKYAQEAS